MTNRRVLFVCNRVAIPKEPPDRFLVMPIGEFESRLADGSGSIKTVADKTAFDMIFNAHRARGIDAPIDFNHQTEDPEFAATGKPPLILGHIANFEFVETGPVENRGIYATGVTWTPQGAELVSTMQLRYPSFAGSVQHSDHRVAEVTSVALTPKPFIDGINPVMNRKVANMDNETWNQARWFLNLPATSTETDIMSELEKLLGQMREMAGVAATANSADTFAAIKKKVDGADALRKAVCNAVSLDPAKVEKDDDIVSAVASAKTATAATAAPDPAKFVSRAEFDAVANTAKAQGLELATLKTESQKRRSVERIANGEAIGKFNKAMLAGEKNHFVACSETMSDGEWSALLERMPVVAPADGRVVATANKAPARRAGEDVIVANSASYDPGRMEAHKRVLEYAKTNKTTYAKALEAVGA